MIDYATIKSAIRDAKRIRDESWVTITDETGSISLYSKSVYDAALEAAGDDEDLFKLVYMLTLHALNGALEWSEQ